MCALIQTRVTPSVSAPIFSVRILDWPALFTFCCYYTPVPWKVWSTLKSWAESPVFCSFCTKASVRLLGFVCFYHKPEHVDITGNPQICFHPLTQTRRRRSSFCSHFLSNSGLSTTFYWAAEPKKWKSERNSSSLFSPVTPAHLKLNFYLWKLASSPQKNTGSSWNYKYQATSQAFPG